MTDEEIIDFAREAAKLHISGDISFIELRKAAQDSGALRDVYPYNSKLFNDAHYAMRECYAAACFVFTRDKQQQQ